MDYFWSNTVWFILLGITTVITMAFVLAKAQDRKRVFAFYLAVSGLTYMAEVTVFLFFKAYDYYPMIFDHISRVDDGLAGNLFSQFSISATALLLCTRKLRFYWYIVFTLAYAGIEEIFLCLGIYKHYWYRTWMTIAGFILLFIIVKVIYVRFFSNPGRVIRYALTIAAVFVPHTILITWPVKLLGYPAFSESVLPDPVVSGMLLFAINFVFLSNAVTAAYFLKLKLQWHAVLISLLFAVYCIAYLFDIVIYDSIGAVMLFAAIQIGGMYLSIFVFDRLESTREKAFKKL